MADRFASKSDADTESTRTVTPKETRKLISRLYPPAATLADHLRPPEFLSRSTLNIEASEGPEAGEWHVVLTSASGHSGSGSGQRLPEALAELLDVDVMAGEELVQQALVEENVILETWGSRKDALKRAQQFRDQGITVRVTADKTLSLRAPEGLTSVARFAKRFSVGKEQSGILSLARCLRRKQAAQPQDQDSFIRQTGQATSDSSLGEPPQMPRSARTTAHYATVHSSAETSLEPDADASSSQIQKPSQPRSKDRLHNRVKFLSEPTSPRETKGQELRRSLYGTAEFRRTSTVLESIPNDASEEEIMGSADDRVGRLKAVILKHRPAVVALASTSGKLHGSALKGACALARAFVFAGVADFETDICNAVRGGLREPIGTRKMVAQLHSVWTQLDLDNSGTATREDFYAYASRSPYIQEVFCSGDLEQLDRLFFERAGACNKARFVMLLWPSVSTSGMQTMLGWMGELDSLALRCHCETPPLLPECEQAGLRDVFAAIDKDGSGTISFEELVLHGLAQSYQKDEMRQWAQGCANGELDMPTFCAMMCPNGYRTNEFSRSCSLADGQKVYYDTTKRHWFLEEDQHNVSTEWLL